MSEAGTRRRIRAQASVNDADVMGFVLDDPIGSGRSVRLDGSSEAPLARALFTVPGVLRIEVSGTTIWVKKDAGADWAALKPAIAAGIRGVLNETERPLGSDEAERGQDTDTVLRERVEELLDKQINPAVAAHGGRINAVGVSDATVYLEMSGGCQGCAASSATLRQGVERMLRAALPQIGEIVDVTDHAAGRTPFYAREDGPSPVLSRPIPGDVIGWKDGQVVVDPEFLAPRLGLTPETLREGLRSGDVVGVTETGEGADAGKTRITLRGPNRAWAAEINSEGAAREIPPPGRTAAAADSETALSARVRAHLEGLDAGELPITYGALARALGLWAPGSVGRVTRALERTMREDAAADRPFIAARVAGRGRDGLPAQGFFDLARALSRGPREGESDRDFHRRESRQLGGAP